MANRFENPLPFFDDSTGAPLEGAQLFFYASGTSTKLNTYSDAGLTIANPNPIVLDSAGRVPNAVFLQNLSYKVVLAPATDTDPPTSPIWTQDPVYTSDYSAAAQFTSGSGNPNGVVAGTAGSATIKASVYWDFTNKILYVCTVTGSASTAVWTAVNASTAANVVPAPQGYLTPTSATPVIVSDATAATTVFYTPFVGNIVPVYSGAAFVATVFSELSLTLTSSQAANTIYDVFVFSNSGVLTLVTGPAWSSSTAGSCARGTGASSTEIQTIGGLYVNAVQITGRNGASSYTIPANQATYLGSLFMDGTNGQVSCYRSAGQSRKWGIWNAYNRQSVTLTVTDPTGSWTYASATTRASNGSSANSATIFQGLPLSQVSTRREQAVQNSAGTLIVAIGWNSTSVQNGFGPAYTPSGGTYYFGASNIQAPFLGIGVVTSLEGGNASTVTFFGTETYMAMRSQWAA